MTNLPNEITIEGETYVKKTDIEQAVSSESKPWPQEGDEFWYVTEEGVVSYDKYTNLSVTRTFYWIKRLMRFGNFFQTEEEAKMYALRIESLSKGFIPKEDEKFWMWDFKDTEPTPLTFHIDWLCPKFPTKEECQEWYNQYGKSWEYLIDKKS